MLSVMLCFPVGTVCCLFLIRVLYQNVASVSTPISKRENDLRGSSPHVSDVVSIDEQESEGNRCDDDDGCHVVFFLLELLLFVSYAPIILYLSAFCNPNRHSKFYFVKVVVTYCHART